VPQASHSLRCAPHSSLRIPVQDFPWLRPTSTRETTRRPATGAKSPSNDDGGLECNR